MPIELGEAEQELQEVREVKERVRSVAKKYAKDYRWCDVVNQALREAGIDDDVKMISLDVDATITAKIKLQASVSELAGKSAEEMNAWVAEQLAQQSKLTLIEMHGNKLKTALPEHAASTKKEVTVEVTDLNLWMPPPPPRTEIDSFRERLSPQNLIEGWELRFTSMDGRVMHLINANASSRYIRPACGATARYGMHQWARTSTRSEHRVCAFCMDHFGVTLNPES